MEFIRGQCPLFRRSNKRWIKGHSQSSVLSVPFFQIKKRIIFLIVHRSLYYFKEMEKEGKWKRSKATNMFLNCDFQQLHLKNYHYILWVYLWGLSIICANTIWLVFVISSSCLLLLQTSPSDVGPLQLLNQEYLAIICNKCQQGWTEASRKCSGQKTHWHSFMQICTTGRINHKEGG